VSGREVLIRCRYSEERILQSMLGSKPSVTSILHSMLFEASAISHLLIRMRWASVAVNWLSAFVNVDIHLGIHNMVRPIV